MISMTDRARILAEPAGPGGGGGLPRVPWAGGLPRQRDPLDARLPGAVHLLCSRLLALQLGRECL